jgi:NAD(P)H-flavin reductase/Pyruvate/2-oxoacid:ferredoxin oxidoreductase delta subunit
VVSAATPAATFLPREALEELFRALRADGRAVIGPTVRDGVVDYAAIDSASELPHGWRDTHAPGRYHGDTDGGRTFGFTVGANGWKRFTFPPVVAVGRARRDGEESTYEPVTPQVPATAFVGVRGCELAALRVQDRVLREGPVIDPDYAARRAATLVVAVECTVAGGTCFCTSMGTGPEIADDAADLVLTELDDGFVVRAGTDAGRAIVERLPSRAATDAETADGRARVAQVRAEIGDPVATDGLPARLAQRLEHPRWAEVAERCLACANCTLVCPTCFCTSATQATDLDGFDAVTERTWDSCFSGDFAKVAGGDFRSRPKDRYRQWLTHKFSSWVDQFGSFGCVGCGRCVTWCPAAIDVREELAIIASPVSRPATTSAVADAPGEFVTGRVLDAWAETADTRTLRIGAVPAEIANGAPGQFLMVTRPGLPAVPISVSRYDPAAVELELSIRAAGPATTTLSALGPGATLGLRGPLGRGWPLDPAAGHDVLVVAGGIGLSPLRPLIDALLRDRARFGRVRLAIGARTPEDRPHVGDVETWSRLADVEVGTTVDRAGPDWGGRVGIVTHLFDDEAWDGRDLVAYACGPERMMQATVEVLRDHGVRPERTFVSLERHMECGVGLCGHCQLGRFFVCRDGPVFTLAELGDAFTLEGR